MHLVIAPFAIVVAGIGEADLPLSRLLVLDEIAFVLAFVAVDTFAISSAHILRPLAIVYRVVFPLHDSLTIAFVRLPVAIVL